MGKSVLAYQFVSGLLPELKQKVAGLEGNFEQQLARARFEEAKRRELNLAGSGGGDNPKKPYTRGYQRIGDQTRNPKTANKEAITTGSARVKCFLCGMIGHYKSECPYRVPSKRAETPAQTTQSQDPKAGIGTRRISAVVPNEDSADIKQRVVRLREELKDAEKKAAISEVTDTMHGITTGQKGSLGPIVQMSTNVNGRPTQALLDTGSPASILSLSFALQILKQDRPKFDDLDQWKRYALSRLEPTSISLKNYGGEPLNIISQMEVELSLSDVVVVAVVQVQKDAPVDLLLGTDLLTSLGITLIHQKGDGTVIDLLQGMVKTDKQLGTKVKPTEKMEEVVQLTEDLEKESVKVSDNLAHAVCLLQATRVPARHQKLVRANVTGIQNLPLSVFMPVGEKQTTEGVFIEEAVVESNQGSNITIIVRNDSLQPLYLEEGTVIGKVEPIEAIVPTEELVGSYPDLDNAEYGEQGEHNTQSSDQNSVNYVSIGGSPIDRSTRLLDYLQLREAQLSEEELSQLQQLLRENADVFALDPSELGSTDLVTHTIDTGDHTPIRQLPRRMPFSLRTKVVELVQGMLDQGIVEPSKSSWASPVVLVRKKDGSMRFCVDYRKLNAVTKLDVFPLPRIDDTLDLLAQNHYFSTLDLASGYWQVRMDPASKEKTALIISSGLYEFNSMPFGLCNAPATFQRLMEVVLSGLARECCMVYLDDILVMGRTFTEHLMNLQEVFSRLRTAKLTLKPQKCKLVRQTVEYLGHIISEQGVAADPLKIEAVRQFPIPTDLKSLRSFLGLASYYRRFIPNFSRVAGPLFTLTRKGVDFCWTTQCQSTFEKMKELLTGATVLVFPNFDRELLLETDASIKGLGAVLAQKQDDSRVRPIAYASRTLQPHEKNYGVSELEALGVVWALKHFRHYIYGHHCQVFTDHEALKALLNTPHPSGKLARWGMAIQELDLEIVHRAGRHNVSADALSRYPIPGKSAECNDVPFGIVAAFSQVQNCETTCTNIHELQQADPKVKQIITYLQERELPSEDKEAREILLSQDNFTLKEGVLYYLVKDKTLRLVAPASCRQKLFDEAHSGVFGGHLREAKIHSELSRHYWWPGMRKDIVTWSKACSTCASRNPGRAVKSPLTPIPVGGAFDRVGVDIIQFPTSKHGNKYAVVFVDYLTKWPEVFAVKDQTAHTVAQLLVEHIISHHGVPAELLSDRGANFLSGLLQEVCSLMGIHRLNTTAYHPQTDGLVERFNRTLTDMLAKTVTRDGADWDDQLPYVLFAYRAAAQESTRESPFFLLYGRDPRLPTETALSAPVDRKELDLGEYGRNLVSNLTQAWENARETIKWSQKRQKAVYDRKSKAVFKEGDRVFLFKPAAKSGKAHKFARPFHGPYRILEVTTNDAKIRPVDRPQTEPILVALDRLRRCPDEVADDFWPRKEIRRQNQQSGSSHKQSLKNVLRR